MIRVCKTDGILTTSPEALAHFKGLDVDLFDEPCLTEEALIAHCSDAAALLVIREPITRRVIQSLRKCKIISRFGAGLDNIDIPAATAAGIKVAYVPDANTDEVSTHALAMMLALLRRLPRHDASVRQGRWTPLLDGAGTLRPTSINLGLLGFGRIGREVARKAAVFGFRILVHDPQFAAATVQAAGARSVSFEELLAASDILSLHLPLTSSTAGLIGRAALAALKPNAIVVNVSRGGLIDEAALAAELTSGRLAGAGLDVFGAEPPDRSSPLFGAPNTILTPHVAHYSEQSIAETLSKGFANVAAVLHGRAPAYPVN
jgi:D-3-phosphoglycerate dehydrogenase / 2-oxoglutarate reductase